MVDDNTGKQIGKDLEEALNSGAGPKIARFALAGLSAIPIVGGAIGGVGGAWSEADQDYINKLFFSWLKLQEEEIKEIGITIREIMLRLDLQDEEIKKRIESSEYLKLLKKAFRDWSAAESEEKRILIRNLLSNAAATKICTDDVVRLFIDWINKYSEIHFKVIRQIYTNKGITRKSIWMNMHGQEVRENSAEADLFKVVLHDLSTGHVARQHRETDAYGNFLKPERKPKNNYRESTYATAFDDDKQYELTELGLQFVHYTMNEIVPRLTG